MIFRQVRTRRFCRSFFRNVSHPSLAQKTSITTHGVARIGTSTVAAAASSRLRFLLALCRLGPGDADGALDGSTAIWPSSWPSVLEVSSLTRVTISVARLAVRIPPWILELVAARQQEISACACKPSLTIFATAASHHRFERRADKTGKSAFSTRQFRVNDRNHGAIRS